MSLYELGQEDKKRDRQVEGQVRVCMSVCEKERDVCGAVQY